jgi:hypothetical protein
MRPSTIDDREPINPAVQEAPEGTSAFVVALVLVITVLFAIGLCLVAYVLLHAREGSLRPSRDWPEQRLPPPHRVAEIRAEPFDLPHPRPNLAAEKRRILQSYGWVDRPRGLVHLPIDVAFGLMLHGRQAGGAR